MQPSLRGLGPRRATAPGPGRRLAPRRPLVPAACGPRGRVLRLITGLAALIVLAALAVLPGSATTVPGSSASHGGPATFTHRTVASPAAFAAAAGGAVTPIPSVAGQSMIQLQSPSPLSTARCLATIKLRCYSPLQYRVAYNLDPLYQKNITGQGQTIMIVDSFGSPTLSKDLRAFDQQWGLPNPPALNEFKLGQWQFKKSNATMDGWAEETTLDVEYAHAIAPGATIDVVETPVAETEGVTGFPQMMAAIKWVIDHNKVDVISQSFGATENTFPGFSQGDYASIEGLRYAFQDAVKRHVTVLAASGDSGATNDKADGATLYPFPVVAWPSSDPLVTSVGGTELQLAQDGNKVQPDQVWGDEYGASGGGLSTVFSRPGYQNAVSSIVGSHRGTPDISMSAAVSGGAWIYQSFEPGGPGWEILGGTSEATPIFAGMVALASQKAGHPLGNIDSALYALGTQSRLKDTNLAAGTGIVDVTAGSNSFGNVTGYAAQPGYDLASGWGTIDGAAFVPALAQAVSRHP
jgi:subtilase family serine protease